MVRRDLGRVELTTRLGLATAAGRTVLLQAPTSGGWQVTSLDDAGRTVTTLTEPPAAQADPQGAVVSTGAGVHVWFGRRDGRDLLRYGPQGRLVHRKLPQGLVGLVGQGNGDAVVVLAGTEGLRVARLTPDGPSTWDRPVNLPGVATAVAATLRDDIVLLGQVTGQVAGRRGAWFLARMSQADGQVLWTRTLDAKVLPPDLELAGFSASPRGVAVLAALARSGQRRDAPWLLQTLDANGLPDWRAELPRSAPDAVLVGRDTHVYVGQARDGGTRLVGYDAAGKAATRWAVGWTGLEVPVAVGFAAGGTVWAASLAPHADASTATLLATRWHLDPAEAKGTCEPGPCAATRQEVSGCAAAQLADDAPCSPLSRCRAGKCGGIIAPPAPAEAPPE